MDDLLDFDSEEVKAYTEQFRLLGFTVPKKYQTIGRFYAHYRQMRSLAMSDKWCNSHYKVLRPIFVADAIMEKLR